jgi:hypothetical protein
MSNDWSKFSPWIVAVEDHCISLNTTIHQFMAEKGYTLFAQAFVTKIFVRNDLSL